MKLTIKVNPKEERSILSIIKIIDTIPCKVSFDAENGIISIQTENGTVINEFLELIEKNYTVKGLEIDNTDYSIAKAEIEVAPKVEIIKPQTTSVDAPQINVYDPISDEFERFMSSYYMVSNKGANTTDAVRFLKTAKIEMSLNFSDKKEIDYRVGDIVECYYGTHLPMEINGAHVYAMICDIIDDMVYVLPITKATGEKVYSKSFIEFNVPDDVTYVNDRYTSNGTPYREATLLLDKGKYIHQKRINSIVGRADKYFFKEAAHLLLRAIDFTSNISVYNENGEEDAENETAEVACTETQTAETINDEAVAEETVVEETTIKEAVPAENPAIEEAPAICEVPKKRRKNTSPKQGTGEAGVYEFFSFAIQKLTTEKPAYKQDIQFIKDLGMDCEDKILIEAFSAVEYTDTLTYEKIAELICDSVGRTSNVVVFHLKMTFQKWLKSQPELKEKYPRISLMSFLKVFEKEIHVG